MAFCRELQKARIGVFWIAFGKANLCDTNEAFIYVPRVQDIAPSRAQGTRVKALSCHAYAPIHEQI
jgi:hypothetical protein